MWQSKLITYFLQFNIVVLTSVLPWFPLSKQETVLAWEQKTTHIPEWCLVTAKEQVQEQQWKPDDSDSCIKIEGMCLWMESYTYDPETRPQVSTEYSMLCINRMSIVKYTRVLPN